ncbi:MAG: hypothetical protein QXQ76_05585 [Candidatus Bathyarchaeia archaeon]
MRRKLEPFESDLSLLLERLSGGLNEEVREKLRGLKDKLIRLHMKNVVKINHSAMELICAKHLLLSGYEVDVERLLDGISCDIYASKGLGSLIVEVETGYIPPEHALDPLTYCKARIASKITRYSGFATKFGLAAPPHYIMQIPDTLIKPPRYRSDEEIGEIKRLCDLYYKNPPVSIEEIRNARLHMILIIDVDRARIQEVDPVDYIERGKQWAY